MSFSVSIIVTGSLVHHLLVAMLSIRRFSLDFRTLVRVNCARWRIRKTIFQISSGRWRLPNARSDSNARRCT